MKDTDVSEKELVRDILNASSNDKGGTPIMINGHPATNKELVYYGLMKAAAKGNTKAAELLLKQGGMIEVDADGTADPEKAAEERKKNRKRIEDRVAYYRNRIETILKEAGVYESRQIFQIEICATNIMSYRKMRETYLDPKEPCYIVELSREGTPRKKPNPLAGELRQEGAALAANLAKLTMNIKDAKKKEDVDDKFNEFMKQFQEDDD